MVVFVSGVPCIVSIHAGLAATYPREAVKAAAPRVRRAARAKFYAETFFVLYSAASAVVVMLWLATLPGITHVGWLLRALGTLPSIVFQALWARTCFLYWRVERASRGGTRKRLAPACKPPGRRGSVLQKSAE